MKPKQCCISGADRCRLGALLASREGRAWGRASCLSVLNSRLEAAEAVDSEQVPIDLVTMNCAIDLIDGLSGERSRVTLTYPNECEFVPDAVSVFEPLGAQLIGSRVGDVLTCENTAYRIARVCRHQRDCNSTAMSS